MISHCTNALIYIAKPHFCSVTMVVERQTAVENVE